MISMVFCFFTKEEKVFRRYVCCPYDICSLKMGLPFKGNNFLLRGSNAFLKEKLAIDLGDLGAKVVTSAR